MKIKNAFTLAEVLITLAIIGVVAALTLPVLSDKIGNIVLENQRKKTQSVLANGIKMMLAQEGQTNLANTSLKRCRTDSNCLASEIGKYFKVVSDSNSRNDMFAMMYEFGDEDIQLASENQLRDFSKIERAAKKYKISEEQEFVQEEFPEEQESVELKAETKSLNGDYAVWQDPGMNYVFITADGTILGIMNNAESRDSLTILADVNGGGLPNSGGRDLCTYNITSGGSINETCSSSFIPTVITNEKAKKAIPTETKSSQIKSYSLQR